MEILSTHPGYHVADSFADQSRRRPQLGRGSSVLGKGLANPWGYITHCTLYITHFQRTSEVHVTIDKDIDNDDVAFKIHHNIMHFHRELIRWKKSCQSLNVPRPEDLLQTLTVCDGDVFPNVGQLFLIGDLSYWVMRGREKFLHPEAHQTSPPRFSEAREGWQTLPWWLLITAWHSSSTPGGCPVSPLCLTNCSILHYSIPVWLCCC